jgi:RNA polymerase sigma-70 factor (ECF subfamily)
MITEQEIQKLVAKAQESNESAFGELYDIFSQQLYNFLLGKLAHKETAEDLVQTVFLKAWTNLNKYECRPTAKFSTWLFQIANFTLIDHWRAKKTVVEINEVENLAQFAVNPAMYEEYDYLWKGMSKLPLTYQTVLDLRFKQDLSVAETAKIMNKSQVSIRVLQHRALKLLKDTIQVDTIQVKA